MDDELRRLKDPGLQGFKAIREEDPMFFLVLTRLNKISIETVRTIAGTVELQREANRLSNDIKLGNWNVLTHHYLRNAFPNNKELAKLEVKYLLFYAYWSGQLSRCDFHTANSYLNLKEQIEEEISPAYQSEGRAVTLPKLPGSIEICRLFDGNGKLTPAGRGYIDGVASNDPTNNYPNKPFDRNRFMQSLQRMPKHLQVMFKVNDIRGEPVARDVGLNWFYREFIKKVAGTPLVNFEGKGRQKIGSQTSVFETFSFAVPSYGVLHEFILHRPTRLGQELPVRLRTHDTVTQPVMALGVIGSDTEGRMHDRGYHLTTIYGKVALKNLLEPHGFCGGATLAEIHDALYHTPRISQLSEEGKKILHTIRTKVISAIPVSGQDTGGIIAKEAMTALLADLDIYPSTSVEDTLNFLIGREGDGLLNRKYFYQGQPFALREDAGVMNFFLTFVRTLKEYQFSLPYGFSTPKNMERLKRMAIKRSLDVGTVIRHSKGKMFSQDWKHFEEEIHEHTKHFVTNLLEEDSRPLSENDKDFLDKWLMPEDSPLQDVSFAQLRETYAHRLSTANLMSPDSKLTTSSHLPKGSQLALTLAVQMDDWKTTKRILTEEKNIDKNPTFANERTLLSYAVYFRRDELVKLIASAENVRKTDNNGMNALHLAALAGNIESLKTMLSLDGIDAILCLHELDGGGRTPFFIAAENGQSEVIEFIAKEYPDELDHYKDAHNSEGIHPLAMAAFMGHFDTVVALLNIGVSWRCVNSGVTPIQLARRRGHLDIVGLLETAMEDDPIAARQSAARKGYSTLADPLTRSSLHGERHDKFNSLPSESIPHSPDISSVRNFFASHPTVGDIFKWLRSSSSELVSATVAGFVTDEQFRTQVLAEIARVMPYICSEASTPNRWNWSINPETIARIYSVSHASAKSLCELIRPYREDSVKIAEKIGTATILYDTRALFPEAAELWLSTQTTRLPSAQTAALAILGKAGLAVEGGQTQFAPVDTSHEVLSLRKFFSELQLQNKSQDQTKEHFQEQLQTLIFDWLTKNSQTSYVAAFREDPALRKQVFAQILRAFPYIPEKASSPIHSLWMAYMAPKALQRKYSNTASLNEQNSDLLSPWNLLSQWIMPYREDFLALSISSKS